MKNNLEKILIEKISEMNKPIVKKASHIGLLSQHFDNKNYAQMASEMAALPKYEPLINILSGNGGIVNFVTNNQYAPLIEKILHLAVPVNTESAYHMGNEYTVPGEYSIDASQYFPYSDAKKVEQKTPASDRLADILFGKPITMLDKEYCKIAGFEKPQDILDVKFANNPNLKTIVRAALSEYAKLSEEHEKVSIVSDTWSNAKNSNAKSCMLKAYDMIKTNRHNAFYNKKLKEIGGDVKQQLPVFSDSEYQTWLARFKAKRDQYIAEKGETLLAKALALVMEDQAVLSSINPATLRSDERALRELKNAAFTVLTTPLRDGYSNEIVRSPSKNGFIDFDASKELEAVFAPYSNKINGAWSKPQPGPDAVLKSDPPGIHFSGEHTNVGPFFNFVQFIKGVKEENDEVHRAKENILKIIDPPDSDLLSNIKNAVDKQNDVMKNTKIIFSFLRNDKGRAIIFTNVENSIFAEDVKADGSESKLGGIRNILQKFVAHGHVSQSTAMPSSQKKTIILVSSMPLSNIPNCTVVNMKSYPVDADESNLIVEHILNGDFKNKFMTDYHINGGAAINRKLPISNAGNIASRNKEQIALQRTAQSVYETTAKPSQDILEEISATLIGLGQNEAINTVKKGISEAMRTEKIGEHSDLTLPKLDQDVFTSSCVKTANAHHDANVPGMTARRSKVKFEDYVYKKTGEEGVAWANAIGKFGQGQKEVANAKKNIEALNAKILAIDKELMSNFSENAKLQKLGNLTDEAREAKQKEIEDEQAHLHILKANYIKAKDAIVMARALYMKELPHIILLYGKAGTGKCLGRGTKVMMFDGTTKNVEDVQIGELLMGPDSKPRTVLSTTSGIGPLYKVEQKNGDDYICNDAHILSLQNTDMPFSQNPIFITAKDFHEKNKTWRKRHKGWKASVDFDNQELPIDPYWMGLWLGDGNSRTQSICVGDKDVEIASFLERWNEEQGLFLRKEDGMGCKMYHFSSRIGSGGLSSNKILDTLRSLNLIQNKHIPEIFYKNSEANRLALLAGLIDSDGYVDKNGSVSFANVNKKLAEDVLRLARSLGFRASLTTGLKSITKINYSVLAYNVSIGGCLSRIPTKLTRKQTHDNPQKKHARYGINVNPIGTGEYFGFTIDGDRQFLLGDFTVTHNTVWADALADLFNFSIKDINFQKTKSKWYGETGNRAEAMMDQIRSSRNTVFLFDELDRDVSMSGGSMGGEGGQDVHAADKGVVKTLLTLFEEDEDKFIKNNVFFVITTNYLANIDKALLSRTKGNTYKVDAPDDKEDYKRFIESFLNTEKRKTPDAPWLTTLLEAEGKTYADYWDELEKLIAGLDLDRFCSVLAERKVGFRTLQGMIRMAVCEHNSWLVSQKRYKRGATDKIHGMPFNTTNLCRAASIATDGADENSKNLYGIQETSNIISNKINKDLMKNGIQSSEMIEIMPPNKYKPEDIKKMLGSKQLVLLDTGKIEDNKELKYACLPLPNGKADNTKRVAIIYYDLLTGEIAKGRALPPDLETKMTWKEEEVHNEQFLIEEDQFTDANGNVQRRPRLVSKNPKLVPPEKPFEEIENNGFESKPLDQISKAPPKVDATISDQNVTIPENKKGKPTNSPKQPIKAFTNDYYLDYLIKSGVINHEDATRIAFKANPQMQTQPFDDVEKYGCYYFSFKKSKNKNGQFFIGPAGMDVPPQKLT